MKGREHDALAAVADGLHHTGLHLAGRFFRKGQPEDVLAEQQRIGFEQMPDAFGDYPRFAGARTGDDQKRAFAMRNGSPLRFIQEQFAAFRLPHVKQRSGHRWEAWPEATRALKSADLLRGTVSAVHLPDSAAKCFAR